MKQYAIISANTGFLQWMGEAVNHTEAVTAMVSESPELLFFDQSSDEPLIEVYVLSDAEAVLIDKFLDSGTYIFQDFSAQAEIFTCNEVRKLAKISPLQQKSILRE